MEIRTWLCLAHMGGMEQKYIQEAFDTNWVVPMGPNVYSFEKELECYLGEGKSVLAMVSCTSAIHLGLKMLGVGEGDEVICQSFTFCASANPVSYVGAKAVFVDSEAVTWNMSPELLEKAIIDRKEKTGKYPKAIIVVHLYGMPSKMDEIMAIADKYGVLVLEDAAEALGAEYKGKKCGTFGHLGMLSFNGNKMITTSGGGALICNSEEQRDKARFYATQAREKAPYYLHKEIGYNYSMSNICAGIGRGQMHVLAEHLSHHRMLNDFYAKAFEKVDGVTVFRAADSSVYHSNYWLSCVLIDKDVTGYGVDDMRVKMAENGIETRQLWKPMHTQPVYEEAPSYVDGTSENLFNKGLCIPSGPMVSLEEAKRIVSLFG